MELCDVLKKKNCKFEIFFNIFSKNMHIASKLNSTQTSR